MNAITLNQNLSDLEKIPFTIDCKPSDVYLSQSLKNWLDKADKLLKNSGASKKECDQLMWQATALRYRSGQAPDLPPERKETLFRQLKELALSCKQNPKLYKDPSKTFTAQELSQLRRAAERYPLFVEKILKERGMAEEFVKWSLRSECSVDVFVELPNERHLLSHNHLDKRAGVIDKNEGIKFETFTNSDGNPIRALALRIDGRYVNVQGDNKDKSVALSNFIKPDAPPYVVKVKEIYAQFKAKTHFYGNVDYLQERGISNWMSFNWGCYNPEHKGCDYLPIQGADFLSRLPVFKTATREELQQSYPGQTICQPGQFGLILNASRAKTNMNIAENHGYLTFVSPTTDGKFNIYPMCIQAERIPITKWDKFSILANTMKAGSVFPDESFFLSNRQRFGKFYIFNDKATFDEALTLFGSFVIEARKGKLIFQPQGSNCAHYVQKIYNETIAKPFFSLLEKFTSSKNLDKALFYFDDSALKRIVNELVDDLYAKNKKADADLIVKTAFDLLSVSLFKDDPTFKHPTTLNKKEFKELLITTVRSQQHYRTYLFKADFDSGLQYIVPLLKWIPSAPLRNFITSLFLFFFLGAWRSYNKQCLAKSPYFKQHTFNLPSGLFANTAKETDLRNRIKKITA